MSLQVSVFVSYNIGLFTERLNIRLSRNIFLLITFQHLFEFINAS